MPNITKLREKVDKTDSKLINVLEERFKITNQMMVFKDSKNILRTDKIREREIIKKLQNKTNLSQEFIEKIMNIVFEEAKNA